MIINMNESKLCTIELIEQFLAGTLEISVTKHGDEASLYQHITRVLKRFDFPRCSKYERGVLLERNFVFYHSKGLSYCQKAFD